MDSLEKKLKQNAKMGTEIENLLDTDLEDEWKQVAEIQWVKLEDVKKELGVVAQKIRERFQNAYVAPFGWYKNLQNLEKEVLGLLMEREESH